MEELTQKEYVNKLEKQKQNILEEYNRIKADLDRYRELVTAINGKQQGDYLAWIPGDVNHLESLSCPVLIPAEWLRNLLDDAKKETKVKLRNAYEKIRENLADANKYDSDDYTPPEAGEEEADKWLDYIFTCILPYAAEMAIGTLEDELG